jgi:exonuclease-1
MAYNLIKVLQQNKIDYVVAPYEADAQLTYLSLNGIADAVITEDSDLIPYGATRVCSWFCSEMVQLACSPPCSWLQIIFKLDKIGNGKEIRLADLAVVKEMDLATFNAAMIRHMCILSGCDYLEGVNGLGVKKAHTLIKKYKDDMTRVFRAIRELKNSSLPEDYEERFKRADLTFQHQVQFHSTFTFLFITYLTAII